MEKNKRHLPQGKYITFIIVSFCMYIMYSSYINGFGTNAPVIMSFYQITSAQHGLIITMQSIGMLSMSIHLSLHGERYNKIYGFAIGFLVLCICCAIIGFAPSYFVIIILVILCGAACSVIDIMLSSIIVELYPKQKNTLLPIAHAFFSIGAVITPLIITAIVNPEMPETFVRPFLLIAILGACFLALYFVTCTRIIPETKYADMAEVKKSAKKNPIDLFKQKKTWLFLGAGILCFSYTSGIMNWLPSYGMEIGMDFSVAGTMLTMYFAGALVMRFCSPFFLKKITARQAFILFSLIGLILITTALFLTNHTVIMVLVTLCGFMQGSTLAFLILMAVEAFPDKAASASSLMFISMGSASMVTPLWMGAVAEHTGFRVPLLIGCFLFTCSIIIIARMNAKN